MKENFCVSGYPVSQIIISGFIAVVSAIPIVVLWTLGKPINLMVILATTGMFVICIAAVLAQPFVTISVDSRKETLTVQWKSFFRNHLSQQETTCRGYPQTRLRRHNLRAYEA